MLRTLCARSPSLQSLNPELLEPRRLMAVLGGSVYVDLDNDGVRDANESGIANVNITLTGTTKAGVAVSKTVKTNSSGFYSFENLAAGTYSIKETQPSGFADGKDTAGGAVCKISNDLFTGIVLSAKSCFTGFNFGERPIVNPCTCPPPNPTPPPTHGPTLGKGMTATIGFWHNKNGQKLLTSLNGGANATNLGNWLATTFPNLFASLAGKTNAQVAAHFVTLFNAKNGPKVEAQVLGLAFATYVTDSDLAGNVAASFGFRVSAAGTGAATVNVGKYGEVVGVADNSTVTVMQVLNAINAGSSGGVVFGSNHSLRIAANELVSMINEGGDR